MKRIALALAFAVMTINLSGCAALVLKDTDKTGAKIGKATARTLFGILSLGTSEISMTNYRNQYKYTRSWEKAVEKHVVSDEILTRLGPPQQKQSLTKDGGEVWVYQEDWGVSASGYANTAYAQGHGRKTILIFNKEGVLTDFNWNSW